MARAQRESRGGGRRDQRSGRDQRGDRDEPELIEKLVGINRVAKVVKGGRRFGFAALVVVGDGRGRVGVGHCKAREVPEAIRKATEQAKRGMIRVPLREGRTLHHDVKGHYGAGLVVMRAAEQGTGIIAGGPMRAIFEALGVQDVVAKSVGTSNPHNMIKATFDGLQNCVSPRMIAQRRGNNDAINRWLDENPLVLGLLFLAIGGALLYFGVVGLQRGATQDKRGNEVEGGMATTLSVVRLVAGAGLCCFAIYKIVAG